jgi:ubiquinone/menaquinone biosynthesis C-methylase UbiE
MKRIFFVESEEDLDKLEVRKILRIQCDIGVEVYTCLFNQIPRDLQRFFMADIQGRIAWEPFRGPDNLIKGITLTSNQTITSQYLKLFKQILSLDSTTRFHDATSWIDPNLAIILTEAKQMTTPINDPNAFRQFEYSGWQQSVEQYDTSFGSLTSQVIDPLLDSVNASKDTKLLDIASGPGYVADRASKRGCKVIGIDFSDAMVAKARAFYPELEFWQGEAEALPFQESQFEAAVMNFGLLHLAQPEEALRQALHVICSKAKFGFTVWTKPEESVAFKIVLRAIETYGDSNVALPVGPPFFRYSDPGQCVSALKNAGFVRPTVQLIPMIWELSDHNELFDAFYRGTARTGGLLRVQTNQAIDDIRAAIRDSVSIYIRNNKLVLPMSSVLASAQKP